MPGGLASPSGAGTSGTPSNSTAQVFQPQFQPQADALSWNLASNLGQQYLAGSTPAQQNYPTAETAAMNVANNPFAGAALTAAQNLGPQASQYGTTVLNDLNYWLGNIADPYRTQALGGAQTGAGYGATAAGLAAGELPGLATLPGAVAGLGDVTASYAPSVAALAPRVAAGIDPLQGGAASILSTGFDPQQALYRRTLQQVGDQSNAVNSMYGLASSPYGAGLANQALSNFNIDWQNQQLARQQQALGAASGAYGQAGGLGATAGGLYGTAGNLNTAAGNLYGLAPTIAERNLAVGSGASNLAARAGELPSQANQMLWNNVLQNVAGLNQAAGPAANLAYYGGTLPYQTSIGQSQAALPALTSATNLGQSQYDLPLATLNALSNYMSGGRQASALSGQLGQLGVNQGMAGLGGIGQLLGLGSNFLLGSGGLSGLLGLGDGGLLGNLFQGPADWSSG